MTETNTVNLNDCKQGDKLLSQHGLIWEYIEHTPNKFHPHRVKHPNGSTGTRCDDGTVYKKKRLEIDEDVIRILPDGEYLYGAINLRTTGLQPLLSDSLEGIKTKVLEKSKNLEDVRETSFFIHRVGDPLSKCSNIDDCVELWLNDLSL